MDIGNFQSEINQIEQDIGPDKVLYTHPEWVQHHQEILEYARFNQETARMLKEAYTKLSDQAEAEESRVQNALDNRSSNWWEATKDSIAEERLNNQKIKDTMEQRKELLLKNAKEERAKKSQDLRLRWANDV
jgi:hypothetical protein